MVKTRFTQSPFIDLTNEDASMLQPEQAGFIDNINLFDEDAGQLRFKQGFEQMNTVGWLNSWVNSMGGEHITSEKDMKDKFYYREGMKWEPGMTTNDLKEMGRQWDIDSQIQNLDERTTTAGMIGGFGANIIGAAADPVNFIPVAGIGGKVFTGAKFLQKGGNLGQKILRYGVENSVIEAGISPLYAAHRYRNQQKITPEEIILNIGMAGAIGGAFASIGHGAGKFWHRLGSVIEARERGLLEAELELATREIDNSLDLATPTESPKGPPTFRGEEVKSWDEVFGRATEEDNSYQVSFEERVKKVLEDMDAFKHDHRFGNILRDIADIIRENPKAITRSRIREILSPEELIDFNNMVKQTAKLPRTDTTGVLKGMAAQLLKELPEDDPLATSIRTALSNDPRGTTLNNVISIEERKRLKEREIDTITDRIRNEENLTPTLSRKRAEEIYDAQFTSMSKTDYLANELERLADAREGRTLTSTAQERLDKQTALDKEKRGLELTPDELALLGREDEATAAIDELLTSRLAKIEKINSGPTKAHRNLERLTKPKKNLTKIEQIREKIRKGKAEDVVKLRKALREEIEKETKDPFNDVDDIYNDIEENPLRLEREELEEDAALLDSVESMEPSKQHKVLKDIVEVVEADDPVKPLADLIDKSEERFKALDVDNTKVIEAAKKQATKVNRLKQAMKDVFACEFGGK